MNIGFQADGRSFRIEVQGITRDTCEGIVDTLIPDATAYVAYRGGAMVPIVANGSTYYFVNKMSSHFDGTVMGESMKTICSMPSNQTVTLVAWFV